MYEVSYEAQKKRFKRFDFSFQADDWPILLAKTEQISSNWAVATHKFNALYMLMRNLSLSLFILFMANSLNLIINGSSAMIIVAIVFSFLFSIVSLNCATQYERYFYIMIFEGCIAFDIKMPKFKKTKKQG